ncbi:MAG: NAD(P)H-binding protein [Acidobacteriota bacterium]
MRSPEGASAERCLVAGATGYIGGKLALRLAEARQPPRCLARKPDAASDLARAGCEVVQGDVLDRSTLTCALAGVHTAYYLVHSMGRGASGDFAAADRTGAVNFAEAAADSGVERIIYLGGLGEGSSKHLRSRQETAEALASTGIELTYFRAAVVLGGGSESFQTIYYLVRRLPAMVTPRWTTTRTQPIAVDDVVEYLAAALELGPEGNRVIEIGGPDLTTYGGMMDEMAAAMGRRPPVRVRVPLLTPGLSSLWIGLVTPVDTGVARPLVEGLTTETVVSDPSGMELFEIEPIGMQEAMDRAVRELAEG